MARQTGKAGVATIGSGPISLKVTKWEFESSVTTVEAKAAQDTGTDRETLFQDWKATIEAVYDVGSAPAVHPLVGTSAAIALKEKPSTPEISIAKTGVVTKCNVISDIEQPIKYSIEVMCNSGSDTAGLT